MGWGKAKDEGKAPTFPEARLHPVSYLNCYRFYEPVLVLEKSIVPRRTNHRLMQQSWFGSDGRICFFVLHTDIPCRVCHSKASGGGPAHILPLPLALALFRQMIT